MSNLELKVETQTQEKKVEELVDSKEEVTEEKIEESLNYDSLSKEEKKAIDLSKFSFYGQKCLKIFNNPLAKQFFFC